MDVGREDVLSFTDAVVGGESSGMVWELLLFRLAIKLETLLVLDERSLTGDVESSPGTSRLCRAPTRRGCVSGELVWMGKRVAGGSLDRSRRWLRPFACGAGLLLRDRDAMALLRASMFARRLLSSVLMARMRDALVAAPPLGVWERVEARLSSPKISSL